MVFNIHSLSLWTYKKFNAQFEISVIFFVGHMIELQLSVMAKMLLLILTPAYIKMSLKPLVSI